VSASVDPRALGRAALLGTAGGGDVPLTGTPADGLLEARAGEPVERRVLLAAGARSWLRRAGRVAEDAPEAPSPAADETRPACSASVARRVEDFFLPGRAPLLPEALALLDDRGLRLPFEALPAALTRCQKAHRAALAAVVGERGRWLASHNRAWRWVLTHERAAAPGAEVDVDALRRTFDEGRLDDRVIALCRLREVDPEGARELLEATWAGERAHDRALLLQAIAVSLSLADEPLLERSRVGSTKRLRAEAIELLGALEGSAYNARMAERARGILRITSGAAKKPGFLAGLLGRPAPPSLDIVLPAELPADWAADGVRDEVKPGFGRKASWAYQVLKQVPPSAWAGDAEPAAVVRLFGAEDWTLVLGVSAAAAERADPHWSPVLWDVWRTLPTGDQAREGYAFGILAALVKVMPPDARAERVRPLLREGVRGTSAAWQPLLEVWEGAWPEDVAAQWLAGLRAAIGRIGSTPTATEGDLAWQRSLPSGARKLPLSLLGGRVPELPPVGTEGLRSNRRAWQTAIDTFHDHVAARIDFVRDLDGLPPAPLGDSP